MHDYGLRNNDRLTVAVLDLPIIANTALDLLAIGVLKG